MITFTIVILLHGADGREIRVNPPQITSLYSKMSGTLMAEGLHCMVNLSDGKFVAVIERCEDIQKMLENK